MASFSSSHFPVSTISVQQPLRFDALFFSGTFSSLNSSGFPEETNDENGLLVGKPVNCDMGFNRVDCLVRILHESVKSFSTDMQNHEFARSVLELAKAWVGVDVHAWHKHIAYQAAVYALLSTAMKVRFLPSGECSSELFLVQKILSPKIDMLYEFIDSQLTMRDARLVKWFKGVKLPLIEAQFIPLLHRWHAEDSKSGVAVIILAISCCIAIKNLGAGRISCPMFTLSIPQIVGGLMDLSHKLVALDKLHSLASEAGLEQEFLAHFGAKVVLNNTSQEVVFWIALVQKKLVLAFHRESVLSDMQAFHNTKDLERDLATLGLFAFLGRKTRLFLSGMGVKDLDEQVKDFLSFLECGGVFIYPELSSLPLYQLFMEVVAEEIRWLDFYAAIPWFAHLRRLWTCHAHIVPHLPRMPIEPTKPIRGLPTHGPSGFLGFFGFLGELLKIVESGVPNTVIPFGNPHTTDASILPVVHREPADLMIRGDPECRPNLALSTNDIDAMSLVPMVCTDATERACESFLRKSINKLITMSCEIKRGTQLLFIDMSVSLGLILKWVRGHKLTEREMKKLTRTMADFAAVIPVTILMLLPVSVVGHAAILAAIKKYIPCLIPSPYTSERLDMVKQLNKTKKMEVQSRSNPVDLSSI
ncbi:LETM1-like [Macleaya cordata]|uniref:LETM1-like n=1 Tax=Macleaya cordata TaxID=56857 RepID=A0A200QDL1_MACCD|nr:LETM1-like [Macleaya cordata]